MLAQRLCHGLWALALAALAAACSFPSVEYAADAADAAADVADAADIADAADAADDAADSASGCIVTGNCAEDANKCGSDAAGDHMSCGQKCFFKPSPMCQRDCDIKFDTKMSQCTANCESCAQQQPGCSDAAESCKGLVGAP